MTAETGCWIAYYADHSGATLFASEIQALRFAIETGMSVKFVEFGADIWETSFAVPS